MAAADHLTAYDAFAVRNAVYAADWQKEASAFVQRNRAVLASRPVCLFSSGLLGAEATNAQGRDLTAAGRGFAMPRRSGPKTDRTADPALAAPRGRTRVRLGQASRR